MGIQPGETAFALVSAFDSGARMDQILTGFSIALEEIPQLRMFIVGSGRYEGSTRWKAEELQLGDSVVFLGRGTEAGPIWSAADAAIDASPWASWSRPALVAIAAGVPTAKRQEGVGGWSEELDESLPMISGHPERFAGDLIRLAREDRLRDEIRAQNAEVVQAVDAADVVDKLGDLYRSLTPG
jgi:glycosyltransferase involved in cell wall biosynthesis